MAKKVFYFLIFSFGILSLRAQNYQDEVNVQVWKRFIRAFNEHDTKGFMAVHSKDVVRSPRDAKTVWNYDEYYKRQGQGDAREIAIESKRQLELRFTERILNNNLAVEVGVYKTTMTGKDGISQSYYGRFHVVLRKENGVWKILVDTDSTENHSIDEENFLAAKPME
jgi:ketosteroid isomerase-like protein